MMLMKQKFVIGVNNSSQIVQASTIEALNLKISILADSAYVSLCLGDYVLALEYAKTLLAMNKIPEGYRMLGHLYAAESLIFLDKITEAIEYLKLENLQDLNTFLVAESEEKDDEKCNHRPLKCKRLVQYFYCECENRFFCNSFFRYYFVF